MRPSEPPLPLGVVDDVHVLALLKAQVLVSPGKMIVALVVGRNNLCLPCIVVVKGDEDLVLVC